MRLKSLNTVLILAGVLVIILSAASVPVQASTPSLSDPPPAARNSDPSFPSQSSSCMALLQSAAEQAGVQGEISWSNSGEVFNEPDRINCGIMYVLQRENFETTLTQLGVNEFSDIYGIFPDGICRYPDDVATDISYLFDFHGYYALMETFVDERTYPDENGGIVHQEGRTISWYMDGGGEYCAHLSVRTYTPNVEAYGHAQDPTPIAEALLAVAEANLPLLPPVSDGSNPGADPVLPGENPDQQGETLSPEGDTPLQPENSSDADAGDTNNSLFGIPLPVVLGSFGIPIIGAAAGAIASAVMGALATATSSASGSSTGTSQGSKPEEQSSTASESGKPLEDQPPASEEEIPAGDSVEPPPPQEDGPPPETQEPAPEEQPGEEPEPVDGETEAGTDQETPDSEVDSSSDSRQDSQTGEASEPQKPTSKPEEKSSRSTVTPEQIQLVKDDLKALNQKLVKENVYVLNPAQGDPTHIFHTSSVVTNTVWNYTGAWLTGSTGLTCEGYVEKTRQDVRRILAERIPGSVIEEISFVEESSVNPYRSVGDFLDSIVPENHILFKITLPDGSEWGVDLHQHNNGSGPIFRTWEGAKKPWKEYLGSEFHETQERIFTTKPKSAGEK